METITKRHTQLTQRPQLDNPITSARTHNYYLRRAQFRARSRRSSVDSERSPERPARTCARTATTTTTTNSAAH